MSFYDLLNKLNKTDIPVIQGGMGVGISGARLVYSVSSQGGLGTLSSIGLDRLIPFYLREQVEKGKYPFYSDLISNLSKKELSDVLSKKSISQQEAMRLEVLAAKECNRPVANNIMRLPNQRYYENSVKGSLDADVDVIVSGAGLPLDLPRIVKDYKGKDNKTLLAPIVSSLRATKIILKKWGRSNYLPDAVIVEGPLAGGHIGWTDFKELEEILKTKPNYLISELLPEISEYLREYDIPIIAAGGIFDLNDAEQARYAGASAIQMGTKFFATDESGATLENKLAVIAASKEDIIVTSPSEIGSSCGLPFRVLKKSPIINHFFKNPRNFSAPNQKVYPETKEQRFFCICSDLLLSIGYSDFLENSCPLNYVKTEKVCVASGNCSKEKGGICTIGQVAEKIDKISSVKEVLSEFKK